MYEPCQFFLLRCATDALFIGFTSSETLLGPVQMVVACDDELLVYYGQWFYIFDFRRQSDDLSVEDFPHIIITWQEALIAADFKEIEVKPIARHKNFSLSY